MLAHDMQVSQASSLQTGRTGAPGPMLAVRHLRCQATQQETTQHTRITAKPITAAEFAPFGDTSAAQCCPAVDSLNRLACNAAGQVIAPTKDGKLFDMDDAQLVLSRGTPRRALDTSGGAY